MAPAAPPAQAGDPSDDVTLIGRLQRLFRAQDAATEPEPQERELHARFREEP